MKKFAQLSRAAKARRRATADTHRNRRHEDKMMRAWGYRSEVWKTHPETGRTYRTYYASGTEPLISIDAR